MKKEDWSKVAVSMVVNSPVGELTLFATEDGICKISFGNKKSDGVLKQRGNKNIQKILVDCATQLSAYFDCELAQFSVPLHIAGTEFQKKVWDCMLSIPYGQTMTYGEIATSLGIKKGARAVGRAANTNSIPLVIPCHRVVGADNSLTGFASGVDVKMFLLNLEAGKSIWSLDGRNN